MWRRGGHVKQLFDRAGAIATIVGPALPGWRRLLAGAIAPAALALWSSGTMAASSDCVGATGTSAVTPTPGFLYLQCYKSIQIPGNPLQTFGGSALIRTKRLIPLTQSPSRSVLATAPIRSLSILHLDKPESTG
jgi:hypothetical protein